MAAVTAGARRSLRLTVLFAAVALAIMAGLGGYVYFSIERQLLQHQREDLGAKLENIQHMLRETRPDTDIAADSDRWLDVASGNAGLAVALWDAAGRLMFLSETFPVGPKVEPIDRNRVTESQWRDSLGRYYRAVSGWGRLGDNRAERVQIQITQDVTNDRVLIHTVGRGLAFAMVTATAIIGLLAWVTTRKELQPLNAFVHAAYKAAAGRFEVRLRFPGAPSELTELARAFNTMLERLHASFRRLSEFSSDVAHELRAPINNLLGQTQVALLRTRDAGEYRAVLESNAEEFERLSRMIADMLFLAQVDNARVPLRRDRVDLRAEVEKLVSFHELSAAERDIRILYDGEGMACGDRIMIERAIGNLLSNAVRNSPAGDAVRVEIACLPTGPSTVSVHNAGPGIPPERLDRVFDRFYCVDGSRECATAGSGLGLAIVKSIMELHRGTVRVRSEPGRVTCFTLEFPPTGHAASERPLTNS